MDALDSRFHAEAFARGFARASQYLANMLTSADVLSEAGGLVRSVFSADVVCLCQRSCEDCPVRLRLGGSMRPTIDQVFESGLMAMESVGCPVPSTYAVLPVNVRSRTEAALLVGYEGARALPPHALEALLGVAGLIGTTLSRQRADRELLVLAEERAARAVAEGTERRARLLAEASEALFASADCRATLPRVARLLVPQLADACVVDIRDEGDSTAGRLVATAHADAAKTELLARWASDPEHLSADSPKVAP